MLTKQRQTERCREEIMDIDGKAVEAEMKTGAESDEVADALTNSLLETGSLVFEELLLAILQNLIKQHLSKKKKVAKNNMNA